MIKMLRKKVGIAGFGVVGKRRRDFITKMAELDLVAVCDQNFRRSGKFEDGVTYFTNYKELISQDLDILFVCMSNDMAAQVTKAGLNRDFHVFCEIAVVIFAEAQSLADIPQPDVLYF